MLRSYTRKLPLGGGATHRFPYRPTAISGTTTTSGRGIRSLHDRGIFGYQSPREFTVPDFTPAELENRVRNAALLRLVESYRRHGHRAALLDPLDLAQRPVVPALDPRRYGLGAATPSREEFVSETVPPTAASADPNAARKLDVTGILDFPQDGKGPERSVDEIAARLAEVYCGGVAYEVSLQSLAPPAYGKNPHVCPADCQFMHMPSKHERRFLETLLERSHGFPISSAEQRAQWELLAKSEGFDAWCAKRFPNVKRYGLEGGESMMTAVATVLAEAKQVGVDDVVVGMPHRGRLNLLTQLLDLDMRLLVRKVSLRSQSALIGATTAIKLIRPNSQMRGLPTLPPSLPASQFTDDVLSHLFLSTQYRPSSTDATASAASSDPMTVHLLPNPSHLETITPVALGFARGLQVPLGSLKAETSGEPYELGSKVLSVAIHGDAAFGGQGVVAETLNLASLPHFSAGGTIHLVVNNQLGYTTPVSSLHLQLSLVRTGEGN